MNSTCTYHGNRDETLIAYLYDDLEPAARIVFDTHLADCPTCRREVDELGIVRAQLGQWRPPEFDRLPGRTLAEQHPPRPAWWKEMPAWTQVAAAALLLGVSAAIANLDITYNTDGFSVRTGWMEVVPADRRDDPNGPDATRTAPWRADLAALEEELRTELRSSSASQPAVARSDSDSAAILRRVRTLIDQSEQRQQRELALRIAEVDTNVRAQRIADLRNIDKNFDVIQTNTGVGMRQLIRRTNDLALRVSLTTK